MSTTARSMEARQGRDKQSTFEYDNELELDVS